MRINIWSRKPRFSSIVQSAPKKTFSTSCGSSLIKKPFQRVVGAHSLAEAFIWILASIWLTSTLSPYKSALWASLCEKGIRTVILAAASPNVVTLASFSSRPLEPPAQLERRRMLSSSPLQPSLIIRQLVRLPIMPFLVSWRTWLVTGIYSQKIPAPPQPSPLSLIHYRRSANTITTTTAN